MFLIIAFRKSFKNVTLVPFLKLFVKNKKLRHNFETWEVFS